jgi:hypothetical protein
MHDSGGAMFMVVGMLMTSAVAIFFSWSSLIPSGATDLSDLGVQFSAASADSVFRDLYWLSRWTCQPC